MFSMSAYTCTHTTQLCTHTPDTMHYTEQTVHAVVCSSHCLLQRQIQKVLGGYGEEHTSTNCKSKQLQKHIPFYCTFFLFSPLDENNSPQSSCHNWSLQTQLPHNLPFSALLSSGGSSPIISVTSFCSHLVHGHENSPLHFLDFSSCLLCIQEEHTEGFKRQPFPLELCRLRC